MWGVLNTGGLFLDSGGDWECMGIFKGIMEVLVKDGLWVCGDKSHQMLL